MSVRPPVVRRVRGAVLAASLMLPSLAAWPHAFWLVPFGPAVTPGERVALDLRIGARWPGESTPRLPGLVSDFRVIDAQGSRRVGGREGGTPVGHFEARAPGAAIVVMQTQPSEITLPGPEFQRYLREESLDDALQFRLDQGIAHRSARENFSRAAKTLVVVGGTASGFDRTLGLPFELVPLTNPLAYRIGSPFRVKLLLGGNAAANVRVAALSKDKPEAMVEGRTDTSGEVRLTLTQPGLWTLYAVHLQHAARSTADWESTWASMTFALGVSP